MSISAFPPCGRFFRVLDDNKNIYTQEREIEREKEREEEEGRYVADTI